jgi:diacylglycerol kinase
MVAYVLVFALIGRLSVSKLAVLLLCFAVVISAEMFNTAIELICDREGSRFDTVTKAIKDISAGAVLTGAACSVGVGIIVFARREVWVNILDAIRVFPAAAVLLIGSVPMAILFVRGKKNQ